MKTEERQIIKAGLLAFLALRRHSLFLAEEARSSRELGRHVAAARRWGNHAKVARNILRQTPVN